jgi:hypothetical protein
LPATTPDAAMGFHNISRRLRTARRRGFRGFLARPRLQPEVLLQSSQTASAAQQPDRPLTALLHTVKRTRSGRGAPVQVHHSCHAAGRTSSVHGLPISYDMPVSQRNISCCSPSRKCNQGWFLRRPGGGRTRPSTTPCERQSTQQLPASCRRASQVRDAFCTACQKSSALQVPRVWLRSAAALRSCAY